MKSGSSCCRVLFAVLFSICGTGSAAESGLDPRGEELAQYIHSAFDQLLDGSKPSRDLYVEASMFPLYVYESYQPPDLAAAKAAVDAAFAPEANTDNPSPTVLLDRVIDKVLAVVSPRAFRFDARNPTPRDQELAQARIPPSARQVDSLWVISLPTFQGGDESAMCDNRVQFTSIPESVKGVILDLRGNGGGLLSGVDCMAGELLGPDVSLYSVLLGKGAKQTGKSRIEYRRPKPEIIDEPVVVFVDAATDSGALLFAASLQRLKRARLIGTVRADITGLVLSGQYLRTTARWDPRATRATQVYLPFGELALPNGRPLAKGVTPDVVMATDDEAAMIAAAKELLRKKRR